VIGVVIAVIQRRRGETPTLDIEDEVTAAHMPVGPA
jgi:hypothetical protein